MSIESTTTACHAHSFRSDLFVMPGNSCGVRTIRAAGIYRQATPNGVGRTLRGLAHNCALSEWHYIQSPSDSGAGLIREAVSPTGAAFISAT